jgi:hypothetical protein
MRILISRLFDVVHGLLSKPRGFFEPQPIEIAAYYDDRGGRTMIEITSFPRVALVSDSVLRIWDPEAPSLEELGYGKYDREVTMMCDYYARRPWLWALRAAVWARRRWWSLLRWTHGTVWHTDPWIQGRQFRWRDVRLGSGAAEIARHDAAILKIKIDAQHEEIADLKRDKDLAYNDGWRRGVQRQREVFEAVLESVRGVDDQETG